jgi:hypothetical protein
VGADRAASGRRTVARVRAHRYAGAEVNRP